MPLSYQPNNSSIGCGGGGGIGQTSIPQRQSPPTAMMGLASPPGPSRHPYPGTHYYPISPQQQQPQHHHHHTHYPHHHQEEVTTIFIVGFPDDMTEREFQNMFTFCPGFEAATLKIPNTNGGHGNGGLVDNRQIIGFAKFKTRMEALEARDTLSGRKVDVEKGSVLKAEMAKKNLYTKRGLSNDGLPKLSMPMHDSSRSSSKETVRVPLTRLEERIAAQISSERNTKPLSNLGQSSGTEYAWDNQVEYMSPGVLGLHQYTPQAQQAQISRRFAASMHYPTQTSPNMSISSNISASTGSSITSYHRLSSGSLGGAGGATPPEPLYDDYANSDPYFAEYGMQQHARSPGCADHSSYGLDATISLSTNTVFGNVLSRTPSVHDRFASPPSSSNLLSELTIAIPSQQTPTAQRQSLLARVTSAQNLSTVTGVNASNNNSMENNTNYAQQQGPLSASPPERRYSESSIFYRNTYRAHMYDPTPPPTPVSSNNNNVLQDLGMNQSATEADMTITGVNTSNNNSIENSTTYAQQEAPPSASPPERRYSESSIFYRNTYRAHMYEPTPPPTPGSNNNNNVGCCNDGCDFSRLIK